MSDNYTEPFDESPDADEDPNDFKNLRAKAKKADKYEAELTSLKRENAFMKAGIPMDDPKMGYFLKGYDGELDASAIRQAAIDAGFLAAPVQEQDPAVQQAQQGQQRVMAAAAESQPTGSDPQGRRYEMEQALKEGGLEGLSAVTARYGVTFNPGG
jgi:hypothetical protein